MSGGVVFLGGGGANDSGGGGDAGGAGGADALKERAATALERALAFARAHGGELGLARAHAALRAEPATRARALAGARQQGDGAFAPLGADGECAVARELRALGAAPAFAATLDALALFAELRCDDGDDVERAVRFVEGRADPDGGFGGALAAGADEDARVLATALAAGSLGRSRYARPEGLAAAATWLAARFAPERVEAASFAGLAALALFYATVPDELADEALQWCGRELEKRFRSHRVEALSVVQVLLACQAGSLPGASFAPEELLERLLAEQARDGGFDALCPDGAAARVAPSVDAMRGIIGLCATF